MFPVWRIALGLAIGVLLLPCLPLWIIPISKQFGYRREVKSARARIAFIRSASFETSSYV